MLPQIEFPHTHFIKMANAVILIIGRLNFHIKSKIVKEKTQTSL